MDIEKYKKLIEDAEKAQLLKEKIDALSFVLSHADDDLIYISHKSEISRYLVLSGVTEKIVQLVRKEYAVMLDKYEKEFEQL